MCIRDRTTASWAAAAWFGADCVPAELESWSWDHLFTQLQLQVLEDGTHWEQSPMYHVEVLNACVKMLVLIRAAQQAGRPLSDLARRAVEAPAGSTLPETQAGPGQGLDLEAPGWLLSVSRVMSRQVQMCIRDSVSRTPECDPAGGCTAALYSVADDYYWL